MPTTHLSCLTDWLTAGKQWHYFRFFNNIGLTWLLGNYVMIIYVNINIPAVKLRDDK